MVKNSEVFLPTSILFGLQVGRSTPTHRGLCFVNAQHLVCLQLCRNFACLCKFPRFVVHARHANRALTIDVHTHRFLYVHSPNNSSFVEAPIRVPHDATECEGEVLNPCRSHGMTVSDTVCCSNVLCRSICHRSTQCVQTRVGAGFHSTLRGPLEFGFSCDCFHDCPCVVRGTSVPH